MTRLRNVLVSIRKGALSTPALLFSIFVGFSVLGVLDGTLARMHEAGGASASASSIASYSSAFKPESSTEVLTQWNAWYALPDAQGMAPVGILLLYFLTDIAVIALPLLILLLRANKCVKRRITNFPATGTGAEKRALKKQLAMGKRAAIAYFVFDVVEDATLIAATYSESRLAVFFVGAASILKWLTLGWALLALVIGFVLTPNMRAKAKGHQAPRETDLRRPTLAQTVSGAWGQIVALRAHVAVSALLLLLAAMPGPLGRQLDDAFLLVYDEWIPRFWLFATMVFVVVAMYQTAKFCAHAYRDEPTPRVGNWSTNLWLICIGLIGAAVGGVATSREWPFGTALIVPGVLLLVIGVISFFTAGESERVVKVESRDTRLGMRMAVVLAVIPIVVLITLSARNGIRLLTMNDVAGGIALMAISILGVPATIWLMTVLTREDRLEAAAKPREKDSPFANPWLLAGLSIVIFVGMAGGALWVGTAIGPWAVVFIFVTALVLGLSALVLAGDKIGPYGVVAHAGLRRTPLIAVLIVCFVGTSAIDNDYGYHAARLLQADTVRQLPLAPNPDTEPAPETRTALGKWSVTQLEPNPDTPKEIPLVFVASAGGGIRAAYWTALVLQCLITRDESAEATIADLAKPVCERPRMQQGDVFLASGISGGSLGLATMLAVNDRAKWVTSLQKDFLGPAIAALAFRDIPNSLLRIDIHGEDRAAILERAWEKEAGGLKGGFLGSAFTDGGEPVFPLLALNGTSVTDGCRVTVSALDLARPLEGEADQGKPAAVDCLALDEARFQSDEPLPALAATKDAFDNTCMGGSDTAPKDIALSTAALLSARFPYVSPTGTLFSCSGGDRTFDLDGGLIDSSAALPLAQAWPEIVNWLNAQTVCFSPKLILIENGYLAQTESKPPSRPAELTAPLTGIGSARDATAPAARQDAALAFQGASKSPACAKLDATATSKPKWPIPSVVDFYPVAKPGIEAPLGWTLSSFSQDSLKQQLGTPLNQCSAEIVAAWFVPVDSEPAACLEARKPPPTE